MWWEYAIIFCGTLFVDITPLPLPPAFTLMVALQSIFGLPFWPVIVVGVAGSTMGRIILANYIPLISDRVLKPEKINDIRLLGEKIKTKGVKAQLFILAYTLLPISSTPLFIACGIARLRWIYVIPAFIAGKFTTDSIAVFVSGYALKSSDNIFADIVSWRSATALLIFFALIFALLFIDWYTLLQKRQLKLKFNIWRKKKEPVA